MIDARCSKCNAMMNEGFVLDRRHQSTVQQTWVEGLPERYWFGALRLRGRRRLPVVSHRCSRCGHLESYALDTSG